MPELGGQGATAPPKYSADQLTLFQPGEGRLFPLITTGPPKIVHLPASLILCYLENHVSGGLHVERILKFRSDSIVLE